VFLIWDARRENRRRQAVFAFSDKRGAIPRNQPVLPQHVQPHGLKSKNLSQA